jgi:predicted transcriptional regulator
MDSVSGAELARELNTSVPRISRTVQLLGIHARQANGRLSLSPSEAEDIRKELGLTPRIAGLNRSEVRALAALRDAPLGLVSARAVGRRSGLSPTAAAAALRSLLEKELVDRRREAIAAGRAREEQIWHANRAHSRWAALDPVLGKTRAPRHQKPAPTAKRVPAHLRHLFWNTADAQLDVDAAGPYIARRLLRTMDLQGLAWGSNALRPEDWLAGSHARGLDSSVKQLARNLAGAAR